MAELNGFDWQPLTFAPGRPMMAGPTRIVLSSTETSTLAAAVTAIEDAWSAPTMGMAKAKIAPHLIVDPSTQERRQLIDTDEAAYGLHQAPDGIFTNRHGAIQVAIVGAAADAAALTGPQLAWLGTDVLAPILESHPSIHLDSGPVFVSPAAASTRFTDEQWAAYMGVCGVQHVPDQAAMGPGAVDIAAVLTAAGGVAGATNRSFMIDGHIVMYTLNQDPESLMIMIKGNHFSYEYLAESGLFYSGTTVDGAPSLDQLVREQAETDPDMVISHDHGGHH